MCGLNLAVDVDCALCCDDMPASSDECGLLAVFSFATERIAGGKALQALELEQFSSSRQVFFGTVDQPKLLSRAALLVTAFPALAQDGSHLPPKARFTCHLIRNGKFQANPRLQVQRPDCNRWPAANHAHGPSAPPSTLQALNPEPPCMTFDLAHAVVLLGQPLRPNQTEAENSQNSDKRIL